MIARNRKSAQLQVARGVIIGVLFGLAFLISSVSAQEAQKTETVKVGLTSAFSGATAYYGQDSQKGAELAIEQLQHTMPNIHFSLVTADDECSPAGGASAYRKLTAINKVDVILGSACSGATLGGMPVLKTAKVPGVTFGATNASISEQSGVGGNPYSWRMNIGDEIMGETWASYIVNHGGTKIAILAANNDFGRGAAELYKTLLPNAGGQIVDIEYYDLGAGDVRPQLTKIAATDPNGLLTFAEPPDCALMLRQMNELGIKIQMFSRGGCATGEGLKALGSQRNLANGVLEGTYWAPTIGQTAFIASFLQKYGPPLPYNAALAYYGMLTIAQAVELGGPTAAGIQAGLSKVDMMTGIGPISFDDHDQAHPNMFILTVQNGQIKVLNVIDTEPK